MARRHYHVLEYTPGYIPEGEPATFTNRREANTFAYELVKELRELGYKVRALNGWHYRHYYGERDKNDLGRVVEVEECYEEDCEV